VGSNLQIMKIFLVILHSLALVTGIVLVSNLSDLPVSEEILIYFLIGYSVVVFLINLFKSFGLLTFPRQIGLFIVYVFVSVQYLIQNAFFLHQENSLKFILFASMVLAAGMLIITIKTNPFKFKYDKVEISGFASIFRINFWMYLILMPIFFTAIFLLSKNNIQNLTLRALALVLSFAPLLNKEFFNRLSCILEKHKSFLEIGFSLSQLGIFGRIRNFVFFKDKILSTGMYQIAESDFRSTVRVTTAIQIARILADDWNARYAKLFVMDDYEKVNLDYRLVHKNEDGITVIDDDACMYHLGNSTYVKDKIKWDDRANLFLLKNDIPIAKFKVNEKILAEKIELLNQLDYYGNTLLIHNGHIQDLGHDYTIIFDKIYEQIKDDKKIELLSEIEKKAPTAIFVAKSQKECVNSACFHITIDDFTSINKSEITLSPNKLPEIPKLFGIAKKVKALFRNMQILTICFQIIFSLLALLFYKYMLALFTINVVTLIVFEFVEIILAKRITKFQTAELNAEYLKHVE